MLDQSIEVLVGTFNSEWFWKTQNTSELPNFYDCQSDCIVSAMDEMQFAYSNGEKSLLLSRLPMNETHKVYLAELGYNILSNTSGLSVMDTYISDLTRNTCRLILENRNEIPELASLASYECAYISPFSIMPETELLVNSVGFRNKMPEYKMVNKVNSKIYSTYIEREIEQMERGQIVNSSSELLSRATHMLKTGPIVIKEAYGVSGSGNILVPKIGILNSIVRHLNRQEKKGKKTEMIIEPFLEKKTDFSCQFQIDSDGSHRISSIQVMENNGFKFSGISTADDSFINFLEKYGYFKKIEEVAKQMYADGYFGPVCIDSMVLIDNSIVPIVEINARKSMGLMNERLGKYVERFSQNLKQKLMTINFGFSIPTYFEAFFEQLEKENLLFHKNNPKGILPLSANTFDVNSKLHPTSAKKGRFYYGMLYKTLEEVNHTDMKIKKITSHLGMKII